MKWSWPGFGADCRFKQIGQLVGVSDSAAHRRYEAALLALRQKLRVSCLKKRLNEELAAIEAALGSLTPAASSIQRDRLMFLAGRASADRLPLPRRRRLPHGSGRAPRPRRCWRRRSSASFGWTAASRRSWSEWFTCRPSVRRKRSKARSPKRLQPHLRTGDWPPRCGERTRTSPRSRTPRLPAVLRGTPKRQIVCTQSNRSPSE